MDAGLLNQILELQAAKHPFVLATNLKTNKQLIVKKSENTTLEKLVEPAAAAIRSDRSSVVPIDEEPWFLRVFNPPLRLLIVGAVHIAQPLAQIAEIAGFAVTIIDPRGAFAAQERFPGRTLLDTWPDEALPRLAPDARTAIVTLTHDPKIDDPALLSAFRSDCFYIGALGSKKTHASRLERLAAQGIAEDQLARIHAPVGLAIGAKSPAEIAISIMAQIIERLRT